MLPSYQASFSVPITCDTCIEDISSVLKQLPGIRETSFSLASKLVTTTGTEPPSVLVSAIQSTGRTAILRGSGNANSAAVCILETPPSETQSKEPEPSPVRGLARFIELTDRLTMLDMTLSGLDPGDYQISIRKNGDISSVPTSMGGVFTGLDENRQGVLGQLAIDMNGKGNMACELDWRVWEMVGRGMVVEKMSEGGRESSVVGVVARSAGMWENEKMVCGCSGKTVWEEREEMVSKGML